jgi:hypothetical protein
MKNIIIKIFALASIAILTGCATCSELLDADLEKYGSQIAMAKFEACGQRRALAAQNWQKSWSSFATDRANISQGYLNQNKTYNLYHY